MWVLPSALFSPVCEDTLGPPPDIVGMSGAILSLSGASIAVIRSSTEHLTPRCGSPPGCTCFIPGLLKIPLAFDC